MMTYEAAKQLFDGAGLPLTESHFAQFQCYLAELTETNRHMNLTAITEPAEAWEKHFLDCAILLQKVQLPLGAACIDVGTGAGFPGMVLALLRPDLQVTLLDSLQKRIGFLEQTTAKLGLANVRCIHARAEDGAKLPELREQFDMATARAGADGILPAVCEAGRRVCRNERAVGNGGAGRSSGEAAGRRDRRRRKLYSAHCR
jgi:16S rRNA (guanine527-N7)-methyltransferase